ncbi:Crp/Fnr family transcriptional regulator [Pseudoflavitalea sp. G-6-1-2]|uniref:Crp/Fnr family transcriptional regulator n=1 Tax=Pseudoflavitalea sp. G-6-1-2 TaxID=2728841 RepID=UPI00146AD4BE|nr:Crp/Fnr family transcriptional regulator [Pseudoflavitalea sp. G-6-1-2]NML22625.1 Crp/Fnr family transcriptional regulator [Pseudoflavitalea sp. G-6-1-2]
MQQLLKRLKDIHHISEETQEHLLAAFTQVVLPKNEYLIEEGRTCRHLYFLEQGCLRGFYNLDGKEITHWFGFENDFVTSFHSFITQTPAVENIQLMEGSVLWSISKETLTKLLDEHQEVERLLRIAYEKYYIRLEGRFVNSQFRTATERYEQLLQENSQIVERVPLGYIASYLGISQETLSRVRSRL